MGRRPVVRHDSGVPAVSPAPLPAGEPPQRPGSASPLRSRPAGGRPGDRRGGVRNAWVARRDGGGPAGEREGSAPRRCRQQRSHGRREARGARADCTRRFRAGEWPGPKERRRSPAGEMPAHPVTMQLREEMAAEGTVQVGRTRVRRETRPGVGWPQWLTAALADNGQPDHGSARARDTTVRFRRARHSPDPGCPCRHRMPRSTGGPPETGRVRQGEDGGEVLGGWREKSPRPRASHLLNQTHGRT